MNNTEKGIAIGDVNALYSNPGNDWDGTTIIIIIIINEIKAFTKHFPVCMCLSLHTIFPLLYPQSNPPSLCMKPASSWWLMCCPTDIMMTNKKLFHHTNAPVAVTLCTESK